VPAAANDSKRRRWFASFVRAASRRNSSGVWLDVISTTSGMARLLHAPRLTPNSSWESPSSPIIRPLA
jgi:hypothetical protein